jgi:hypothetical protein
VSLCLLIIIFTHQEINLCDENPRVLTRHRVPSQQSEESKLEGVKSKLRRSERPTSRKNVRWMVENEQSLNISPILQRPNSEATRRVKTLLNLSGILDMWKGGARGERKRVT